MNAENLWGEIPKGEDIKTPISILREQGTILGEATDKLLLGHVVPNKQGSKVILDLYITAPALDNYSYRVLWVTHDISLYPLVVEDDNRLYECKNEQEYKNALRTLLSSPEIHRVISSLLAQSREV